MKKPTPLSYRITALLLVFSLCGGWGWPRLRVSQAAGLKPYYHWIQQRSTTQETASDLLYEGVDFGRTDELIRIKIIPNARRINGGKPIVIKFFPGQACEFGERRACISTYRTPAGQNVIFVTVHSGVGAEAEAFRNAVEGTGFNQAGLPLEKVKGRMGSLAGARVEIVQGDTVVGNLELSAVGRVPARGVNAYFDTPVFQSVEYASQFSNALAGYTDPAQPLIIFETCGWRMRGEAGGKNLENTSAAVYLSVIQKAP